MGGKKKSRNETNAKALQLIINHYYIGGGGSDGSDVIMVEVLDHSSLLVLLPVPCQQNGGVLMEVLVDEGNEFYEDEMTE